MTQCAKIIVGLMAHFGSFLSNVHKRFLLFSTVFFTFFKSFFIFIWTFITSMMHTMAINNYHASTWQCQQTTSLYRVSPVLCRAVLASLEWLARRSRAVRHTAVWDASRGAAFLLTRQSTSASETSQTSAWTTSSVADCLTLVQQIVPIKQSTRSLRASALKWLTENVCVSVPLMCCRV